MVASLLFGVACHGGTDEALNVHLKRIIDSAYTRKTLGGSDIDGEFIAPVIQESHDGDARREIMKQLRQCLGESSGRRWQKIYGGLALIEKLMVHGSPALAIEVAHGHHFDVVQKVSFLEYFDAEARGCTDRRAQNVIRTKAKEVNGMLVPLLQKAANEELPRDAGLNCKDNDLRSTCSKDTAQQSVSTTTGSTLASSSRSSLSTVSPYSSPELDTSPEARIDDAFGELRTWMESADYTSGGSCNHSPRESGDDDSDWEPIGRLPMAKQKSSDNRVSRGDSDTGDKFFTPMPAPAVTPDAMRAKCLMSL